MPDGFPLIGPYTPNPEQFNQQPTTPLAPTDASASLASPAPLAPTGPSPYTQAPLGLFSAPSALIDRGTGFLPDSLARAFGMRSATSAPRVDKNYQRNLTTLTNKYAEMAEQIAALPEPIRNALINYDTNRVIKGASPMTRKETEGAIQSALEMQPATPPPERAITEPWKNFTSSLGDMLKSIPRIPVGLLHEVTSIPRFGEEMQKDIDSGTNPLAAFLRAPGVRLVPGTFDLSNLLRGPEGWRTLATHPLETVLDALPFASKAAGVTTVGRLATEAAEAAGLRPRPIQAVLTGRVLREADGSLVRGVVRSEGGFSLPAGVELPAALGRNRLGRAFDVFRRDTGLGQALEGYGGKTSRELSRLRTGYAQRELALREGAIEPVALPRGPDGEIIATDLQKRRTGEEAYMRDAGQIFKKYETEYPALARDAKGFEFDTWRKQFYRDLERGTVDAYDPALIGELRDLSVRHQKLLTQQSMGGIFRDEFYNKSQLADLLAAEDKATHASRMRMLAGEYRTPSGNLTGDDLRNIAKDIANTRSKNLRNLQARAYENVLDAYGLDISHLRSARKNYELSRGGRAQWLNAAQDTLAGYEIATPALRRSEQEIMDILKSRAGHGKNRDTEMVRLIDALRNGSRKDITARAKNLYDRKPSPLEEAELAGFREDLKFAGRRADFDKKVGKRYTEKREELARRTLEKRVAKTPPARFHGPLSDIVNSERVKALAAAQAEKGYRVTPDLTPEQASELANLVISRQWDNIPGLDGEFVRGLMSQIKKDVAKTWQQLRDEGFDPIFVHRVSPQRANSAIVSSVGPIPVTPSASRERALDLSPAVEDVQISLIHGAAELLSKTYAEDFLDDVVSRVGFTEAQLRERLASEAFAHLAANPNLNYEAALETLIKKSYEKFDPEAMGYNWGGVRLTEYKQNGVYIPKAFVPNLKLYVKPSGILASLTEPINKIFKFNVIGLSPSVTINNFLSNAVTMTAESGPGPIARMGEASNLLRNPELLKGKISDELAGMLQYEHPGMEYLGREAWQTHRIGREKLMTGINAANAFRDSAFAEAARTGKNALDVLAEKNLKLQRFTDNVYRLSQFLYERDKRLARGMSLEAADHAASEMVRRTFVDYGSFTEVERSAMRTIIPFYSFMGHAARFIMRYPFDHPVRAAITARIAEAERERLGSLPGSYLSMIPLPGPLGAIRSDGKQRMFSLRPFDAFGDISDLTTVSGWLAAMNPGIQAALLQTGLVRGEADLYPTKRYNPDTGRMEAAPRNFLLDLFQNTVPRASVLTSLAGINPDFNDVASDDPDAARRMLMAQVGLPRLIRDSTPYADIAKSEIARQTAQTTALNEALKSGDWSYAIRYPQLAQLFPSVRALPPEQVASMQPASRDDLRAHIRQLIGKE